MEKRKVGLALSGGGSRAVAFHYGVIEALYELKILPKIEVVSAISGGALVGALLNLHFSDQKELSRKIEIILNEGLENSLLAKICSWQLPLTGGLHPDIFAEVLDKKLFNDVKLSAINASPLLILNAADLKTGANFKFSQDICGSYRDGGYNLPNLKLSEAVACSAAFTLLISVKKLPLAKNKFAFLTDGGVYDGLGISALMPDKDEKSILTQKCETLIVSDASFPYQENPSGVSRFAYNRLMSAYACSTNRNRSLLYNKLFLLNKLGEIPHVGTIKMDSKHSDLVADWNTEDLDYINKYKTDFKPVKQGDLKLIKARGKKTAETVIEKHLRHLL